ncbi:ROK family protein [Candidatus Omnitrophota bacterium]
MKPLTMKEEWLNERQRKNLSILEAIKRFGPISKTDISKMSGLNIVTVTNYIETFLKSNVVFETELDISTGGRRPILLDLNSKAGFAIGVGMNLLNSVAMVTDLDGNVIHRVKKDSFGLSAKEVADSIVAIVDEVITSSRIDTQKLQGVGVGIAGVVNNKTGSIRWPEKIENKSCSYISMYLPLKDMIEKQFKIPCILENDATVACFGEQWLSSEMDIDNVIYMFSGVGCGIMINREVYRGTSGSAGELSIDNPQEESLLNCDFGSPCIAKRWEADLGLVRATQSILKDNSAIRKTSIILQAAGGQLESIKLAHIFQAAKENDPLATSLLEMGAKRLGIKIASLVNLLNPQLVIIGGGFEEAGDAFLDTVKETVSQWAFEEVFTAVKIVASRLGEDSVALGAASLVVRNVFAHF